MKRIHRLDLLLAAVLPMGLAACKAPQPVAPPPPPPPPAAAPEPPPPPPAPIVIAERIEFDVASAELRPEELVKLNQVASVLRSHPNVTMVELQGHTDVSGEDAKNLLLSQERAEAVRNFLVSQGIEPARLRIRAFGNKVPIDLNETPTGRAANRRVEFRVIQQ